METEFEPPEKDPFLVLLEYILKHPESPESSEEKLIDLVGEDTWKEFQQTHMGPPKKAYVRAIGPGHKLTPRGGDILRQMLIQHRNEIREEKRLFREKLRYEEENKERIRDFRFKLIELALIAATVSTFLMVQDFKIPQLSEEASIQLNTYLAFVTVCFALSALFSSLSLPYKQIRKILGKLLVGISVIIFGFLLFNFFINNSPLENNLINLILIPLIFVLGVLFYFYEKSEKQYDFLDAASMLMFITGVITFAAIIFSFVILLY